MAIHAKLLLLLHLWAKISTRSRELFVACHPTESWQEVTSKRKKYQNRPDVPQLSAFSTYPMSLSAWLTHRYIISLPWRVWKIRQSRENPDALEMQVSPSSLDRIFYGWIFWKAYGWNCGPQTFFSKFFLRIFSQPPKKWLIFCKSKNFHIFRSGDFCIQQTHPKNVTNRKYRSSAFQKIKIFRNRICIFENTTFLSRRKKYFPKCEEK